MSITSGYVSISTSQGVELYKQSVASVQEAHAFVTKYGSSVALPKLLQPGFVALRLASLKNKGCHTLSKWGISELSFLGKVFNRVALAATFIVLIAYDSLLHPMKKAYCCFQKSSTHAILELIETHPAWKKAASSGQAIINIHLEGETKKIETKTRLWFFKSVSETAKKGVIEGTIPVALKALPSDLSKPKYTHTKTVLQNGEQTRAKPKSDSTSNLIKAVSKMPVFGEEVGSWWPSQYFVTLGNTDPSKAEVICFGEKHGDKTARKAMWKFINANYRPGDLVLIEGQDHGKILDHDCQLTRKLREDICVQGWEPTNHEAFQNTIAVEHRRMVDRLYAMQNRITELLPTTPNYTDSDLQPLEDELKGFEAEYTLIANGFHAKDLNPVRINQVVQESFQKLKNKTLSDSDSHVNVFHLVVLHVLNFLEKRAESARFKDISKEDLIRIKEGGHARNVSLSEQIQKHAAPGKRVFVVAGVAHLLNHPLWAVKPTVVQEELARHPFVIFTARHPYAKQGFGKLNPNLAVV